MAPFKEIPTYDHQTGEWSTTVFQTRKEMYEFVKGIFKEPGKYEFDETVFQWTTDRRKWKELGYYCEAPKNTTDFKNYWDEQKRRSRVGVIYKNGNKSWYLTRAYYMWLNFLPIYNKEIKKFDTADVRDVQYHMALYICLAELDYKHAAILKKRQICSSYFFCAVMINLYWFEKNTVLKLLASLKSYIDDTGSWKFLNEYRDFLNEHTAWLRENNPDKALNWYQRKQVEVYEGSNKRVIYRGRKSRITGVSFEKKPTVGVGGALDFAFYEEAGVAPTMDKTVEYMFPAMRSGHMTTGLFVAAGSVGELTQCGPLKNFIQKPLENEIYAVPCDLIDKKGTKGLRGLFIPEQWSMQPYIDQYGNSLVEEALAAIMEERKTWEKNLAPAKLQLRISQHPTTIEEAFANREESIWPVHLVQNQKQRIEDKEYPIEYVELERGYGEHGEAKIIIEKCNRAPMDYPVNEKAPDKRGVVCIFERPVKDIKFGMYYGSIDPIEEGTTTTSKSLCSIHIYRVPVQVFREDESGKKTFHVEQGKLVAAWCGRYDDPNKTHETALRLIELYQAYTITEANKPGFTNYVIGKTKQHFLVPKDQFTLLRELKANEQTHQQYGWKNTGTLFKSQFIPMAIEFLKEELESTETEDDKGNKKVKVVYGIERIPDIYLLKEMEDHQEGGNYDRLISFVALAAFVASQLANTKPIQRNEVAEHRKKPKENTNFRKGPFNNIGTSYKRRAFKNFG